MQLENSWAVFAVGMLGGVIAEAGHWRSVAKRGRLPLYIRSPLYWSVTVFTILLAGLVSWFQFGSSGAPLAVLQIGLGTPLILQKGTTTLLKPEGAMGNSQGLLDFWEW